MPIDASIPLSVLTGLAGGGGGGGLSGFTSGLQMRNQMDAQALQLQQNALQVGQQRRAMDDDTAMRSAIQKHATPDGVDFDTVIDDLNSTGHGTAAFKVKEAAIKQRKDQADQVKASLDATEANLKIATRMVQGLDAEVQENPVGAEDAFQRTKKYLGSIVGPQLADQLGDKYDPVRLKAALTWGREAGSQIEAQRFAFDQAQALAKDERDGTIKSAEALDKWTKIAGNSLAMTQSPEQWARAKQLISDQGGRSAKAALDQFGDFSPEAVARAAQLGMDTKQREDVLRGKEQTTISKGNLAVAQGNLALGQKRLDLEGQAPDLDDKAIDMMAQSFAMNGGQLPSLGMGAKATQLRTKIIDRAAQMYDSLDLASQKAIYEGNKASRSKLTAQLDAITAFEETAKVNLNTFIKQAEKVVDTGSPYLNKGVRAMNEKLLGDPQMAAFNAARTVVLPEFAKIISNPGLTGVLSDSARKEVDAMIAGDATLPQILSVAKVLNSDADARRSSLEDVIKAIDTRMRPPKANARPGEASSSGSGGPVSMRTPDGSIRLIPADKVAEAEQRGAKRLGAP